MTNEQRWSLWLKDKMHKAFSVVNMEIHRGQYRSFHVIARLGKREDALELQRKIQEWLGTNQHE